MLKLNFEQSARLPSALLMLLLGAVFIAGSSRAIASDGQSGLSILASAETVNESVRFSDSFGAFNDSNFPWVYHYSLGWTYLGSGEGDAFWMFSISMNAWLWSNSEDFPIVYDVSNERWLYLHFEGTEAWSYDYASEAWELVSKQDPASRSEGFQELAAVSRFLSMATLGADYETILAVHEQGIESWLDEQFSADVTSAYDRMIAVYPELRDRTTQVNMRVFHEALMHTMMTAEDQLRHKVALALSEILVVSTQSNGARQPSRLLKYYDILVRNAFGNYEDLLHEITLSPVMGFYLSHAGNQIADPEEGRFPDENYAREIMQLFTIGLHELNLDGTQKLDADGNPIPTYSNAEITETARVFTGLFYDVSENENLRDLPVESLFKRSFKNFEVPLVMHEAAHDTGEKTLVGGFKIPEGTAGLDAIRMTVNHLVNHDNTAPFVTRLLIQRLVKSNPSPQYIERVARVFRDNGTGVSGDLKAVVRAILMDPEAQSVAEVGEGGRMRPPYYRIIHLLRAFNASDASNRYSMEWYGSLNGLKQTPFASPTVFNFYLPDFQPMGDIGDAGLVAPEFEITDSRTMVLYMNEVDKRLFAMQRRYEEFNASGYVAEDPGATNPNQFHGHRPEPFKFDYSGLEELVDDPHALVERLDLILTHGQMSRNTSAVIIDSLEEIENREVSFRISFAIYLTMISPDYIILR